MSRRVWAIKCKYFAHEPDFLILKGVVVSKKRSKKSRPVDEDMDIPEETSITPRSPAWPEPLYLDETASDHEPVIIALTPPDLLRCQCEWSDTHLQTFGPRPVVRCEEEPTTVAFQKRGTEDDGPTGAMALCDDHRLLIEHMYPGQCYFRAITAEKKIGGVV
jgi:hypothetical protein